MFSEQIKSLRKKHYMTQNDLARVLHITQQAVAKWEKGLSFPDHGTLSYIASYFDVTTDFLLGISSLGRRGEGCKIPILGSVKAGYNAVAYEEYQGEELADVSDPEEYCYLVVKGDSMMPYIKDGDLALIRRQETLDDGDLGVVIYQDGEGTLKKFYRKGHSIFLEPFNPDYETIKISNNDLDSLFIFGKVVETKTRW